MKPRLLLFVVLLLLGCKVDVRPPSKDLNHGNRDVFVRLPGAAEYHVGSREHPPEQVVSLSSFEICKYEVTEALFDAVSNGDPLNAKDVSRLAASGRPKNRVTWTEAAKFCNDLSRRTGLDPCYDEVTWECNRSKNGYRLPSSAEWEYACRGDSTSVYFWGNDKAQMDVYTVRSRDDGPADVGTKLPNPQSLFDMTGNLREWCDDLFPGYRSPEEKGWRVHRGGSYSREDDEGMFESKCFKGEKPDVKSPCYGIRLVRTAE